jgi:hypothetical protein
MRTHADKDACGPPRADRYRPVRSVYPSHQLHGTPRRGWDARVQTGTNVPARTGTGRTDVMLTHTDKGACGTKSAKIPALDLPNYFQKSEIDFPTSQWSPIVRGRDEGMRLQGQEGQDLCAVAAVVIHVTVRAQRNNAPKTQCNLVCPCFSCPHSDEGRKTLILSLLFLVSLSAFLPLSHT